MKLGEYLVPCLFSYRQSVAAYWGWYVINEDQQTEEDITG